LLGSFERWSTFSLPGVIGEPPVEQTGGETLFQRGKAYSQNLLERGFAAFDGQQPPAKTPTPSRLL